MCVCAGARAMLSRCGVLTKAPLDVLHALDYYSRVRSGVCTREERGPRDIQMIEPLPQLRIPHIHSPDHSIFAKYHKQPPCLVEDTAQTNIISSKSPNIQFNQSFLNLHNLNNNIISIEPSKHHIVFIPTHTSRTYLSS